MKRYNITTSREYQKDGETKKTYPQVGSLVRFEATQEKQEGYILELNMFPGTKFHVFEQKPREDGGYSRSAAKPVEDEVNIDNIPF